MISPVRNCISITDYGSSNFNSFMYRVSHNFFVKILILIAYVGRLNNKYGTPLLIYIYVHENLCSFFVCIDS